MTDPQPIGFTMAQMQRKMEDLRQAREMEKARFLSSGGICFPCLDTGWLGGLVGSTGHDAHMTCFNCDAGDAIRERQRSQIRDHLIADADVSDYPLTLATHPNRKVVDDAERWRRSWLADDTPFMLLWGERGTGKSMIAADLLRRSIYDAITLSTHIIPPEVEVHEWASQRGAFVDVSSLIASLRPSSDEQNSDLLVRARRRPLVVLDDLGIEKPSDWVLNQLYLIVHSRYRTRLWTVFTTNADPFASPKRGQSGDTLIERIGGRVLDRILERALVIKVTGRNLRLV